MASLTDVTYGEDLLDKANLKPWWEVGVSYCTRLLFVYCFIAMFLVDSLGVQAKCKPSVKSSNETLHCVVKEEFVDSECYYQLKGNVIYPGSTGIIAVALTYVVCTFWSFVPATRNAFYALASAEALLVEHRVREDDISKVYKNVLPEDKEEAIKFAIKFLNAHVEFSGKSLLLIYMCAVFARLPFFIATSYFIVNDYLMYGIVRYRSFSCVLDCFERNDNYYCSSTIGMRAVYCGSVSMFLVGVIILNSAYAAIVSICIYCNCCPCIGLLPKDDHRVRRSPNLLFLKKFCDTSATVSPALLELIHVVAVMQMDAVKQMIPIPQLGMSRVKRKSLFQ